MIQPFEWQDSIFILRALRWTLGLSLAAFIGGGTIGLAVALMRSSGRTYYSVPALTYVILFQGTPLLIQLMLSFFGASMFGVDVSPWMAAALALSLNTGAFLGETWRGCIEAIPSGQRAAGIALGLHWRHRFVYIILPQALRIAIAPTVGILVQVVKNTSVASMIGLVEITRAGQIVTATTLEPFVVYLIVAGIYFALCWPLSLLSGKLEARSATSRATRRSAAPIGNYTAKPVSRTL